MKLAVSALMIGGVLLIVGPSASIAQTQGFGQYWRPLVAEDPASRAGYLPTAAATSFRPIGQRWLPGRNGPVQQRNVWVPDTRVSGSAYPVGQNDLAGVPAFAHAMRPARLGMPDRAPLAPELRPTVAMMPYAGLQSWRPHHRALPPLGTQVGARLAAPMPAVASSRQPLAMAGAWRPVANSNPPPARYAGALVAYTAYQPPAIPRNGWRTAPTPNSAIGLTAMAQPQWRPTAQATLAAMPADAQFRPAGYGRNMGTWETARLAAAQVGGGEGLPGWATTHPEAGLGASCDWCSGS